MLLQGKRNLSKKQAQKLAGLLELRVREKRYFQTLVLFNQAKTGIKRNENYENLMKIKLRSKIILLAKNDDEAESVFQVNMQFFPLSKIPKLD